MNIGNLVLGIFLILLALVYFGVPIPALVLGIGAMIAGILILVGPLVFNK